MSKYSPITQFLQEQPAVKRDLTVSFDTLERLLGEMLPESAYKYRAWWANEREGSHSQARSWMESGWEMESVDFSRLLVRFRRISGKQTAMKKAATSPSREITIPSHPLVKTLQKLPERSADKGRRIVLVSCVKSKTSKTAPAQDLYISDLFKKTSAYAKLFGDRWYILSAKYGLLAPDQVIEPYEKTLNKMGVQERKSWAKQVMLDLEKILSLSDEVIFLAGKRYRENLIKPIEELGCQVSIPMEGLTFGNQLKWLRKQLG